MSARFDLVTVDAVDADGLAVFWSAALGLQEHEREDEAGTGRWIVLADRNGTRRLGVQRIAGLVRARPVTDGPAKARWHLDVVCALDEVDAECDRLQQIGASLVRQLRREVYGAIAAFADPEGNLFDLCAYATSGG